MKLQRRREPRERSGLVTLLVLIALFIGCVVAIAKAAPGDDQDCIDAFSANALPRALAACESAARLNESEADTIRTEADDPYVYHTEYDADLYWADRLMEGSDFVMAGEAEDRMRIDAADARLLMLKGCGTLHAVVSSADAQAAGNARDTLSSARGYAPFARLCAP